MVEKSYLRSCQICNNDIHNIIKHLKNEHVYDQLQVVKVNNDDKQWVRDE